MAVIRAVVCNKKGLHARAAAKVVKVASAYDAGLKLTRLPKPHEASGSDPLPSAGATSILSLLMLAAEQGAEVEIEGEGAQAEEAVTALAQLIARKFDEEE